MLQKYIFLFVASLTILTSCDNWLTVEPKDMVTVDKALDTEAGYTSALVGVYQTLEGLYSPGGFMMGNGVDVMANIYLERTSTGSPYLHSCYNHDYDNTYFDGTSGTNYLQFYRAIANLNLLISEIESRGVLTGDHRNMIEGEAKALRAFLHFDLWRIYGTVPGDEVGTSEEVLPYATEMTTDLIPKYNYTNYFNLILNDLEDAKALLAKSDPIIKYSNTDLSYSGSIDEYGVDLDWYNRQNRFNYYATLGVLARVQLWMGEVESAYNNAKEVIEAVNEDGTSKFRLCNGADLDSYDNAFFDEQLFGIQTSGYDDVVYNGSMNQAVCFNRKEVTDVVFDQDRDIRGTRLIDTLKVNGEVPEDKRLVSQKYYNMSETDAGIKSFPVIRLAEMYLILIETTNTLSEAQEYLNELTAERIDQYNASNDNILLTEDNRQDYVQSQFIKEFWAEGQIFFMYKRLNYSPLPISNLEMTYDTYRVPLPTGEISSN